MRIAIASGKGGTGKTTVATNLARTLANLEVPVSLLDCDVEEPDCHLFLRPRLESRRAVTVPLPQVDQQRCTSCGTCEDVCAFNAISVTRGGVLVFPDLCEGCGAIVDLEVDLPDLLSPAQRAHPGVEVRSVEVTYRGLCPQCKAALKG